jgi:uncharacterized membrane protein YidH (DUF202 family)
MYRTYVRENIAFVSVFIFIIIFGIIQLLKPSCFYNNNGSIREFGIGYKNKTILPIWLSAILLGILCYLGLMYYASGPKLF